MRAILKRDCETHRKTIDCHALAEFYQSLDRNFTEAARIFEELCQSRKHAASCYQSGVHFLTGKGVLPFFSK